MECTVIVPHPCHTLQQSISDLIDMLQQPRIGSVMMSSGLGFSGGLPTSSEFSMRNICDRSPIQSLCYFDAKYSLDDKKSAYLLKDIIDASMQGGAMLYLNGRGDIKKRKQLRETYRNGQKKIKTVARVNCCQYRKYQRTKAIQGRVKLPEDANYWQSCVSNDRKNNKSSTV